MAQERQGTGYKLKQETLRSKYRKGKLPQTYTLKKGEGLTKAAEALYGHLYPNDESGRILAQRHAFELARYNRLNGGLRAGQVLRAGRINPYAREGGYRNPYWAQGFGGAGAAQAQQAAIGANPPKSALVGGGVNPAGDFAQRRAAMAYQQGQQRVSPRGSGWQGMPQERVSRRQQYTGQLNRMQKSPGIGKNTFLTGVPPGAQWGDRQSITQAAPQQGDDFAQRSAAQVVRQQQNTAQQRGQYRSGNVVSPVRYGIYPYISPDVVYQEREYVQRAFDNGQNPDYIPNYVASALGLDPAEMIAAGYIQGSTGSWWQSSFIPSGGGGGGNGWNFSGYSGGGGYGYGYGGGGGGGWGGGGGGNSYGASPSGRTYFDATSLGPVSWRI